MAPRRVVKINNFDYNNLTANDVLCPICRGILIEPITLPCHHGFCASCFGITKSETNLVCPLCRTRVGSWYRSASKSKKLINEQYWRAIQNLFPLQVQTKMDNLDRSYIKGNIQIKDVSRPNNVISAKMKKKTISTIQTKDYYGLDTNKNKTLTEQLISTATPAILVNNNNNNNKKSTNVMKLAQNVAGARIILNNFETKEYTCRILCQNLSTLEMKKTNRESQIQMKNRQIQKITKSEDDEEDRSNSIESECLYFKPIDYRHNPPSKGSNPLKIPTRKPVVNSTVKILAPCGNNTIKMNPMASAFVHLSITHKSSREDMKAVNLLKRKQCNENYGNNVVEKKLRRNYRTVIKNNDKIECKNHPCDSNNSHNIDSNRTKNNKMLKRSRRPTLQEIADFELAKKLQDFYNQPLHSTRSRVSKVTAKA